MFFFLEILILLYLIQFINSEEKLEQELLFIPNKLQL